MQQLFPCTAIILLLLLLRYRCSPHMLPIMMCIVALLPLPSYIFTIIIATLLLLCSRTAPAAFAYYHCPCPLELLRLLSQGTALIDARSGCRAYMQYSEDPRTDVPDSMVNMAVKAMLPANQRKSTSAAHELQKTKPKPVVLKDPPVFGEDTVAVEPSGPPPFEPGSLAPLKASLSDLKAADVQCEDLDQDAYGGRWCRC